MATFQRRIAPTRQFSSQGVVGSRLVDRLKTVFGPSVDRETGIRTPSALKHLSRGEEFPCEFESGVEDSTDGGGDRRTDDGGCEQFGDRSRIHKRRRRRGWV